MSLIRTRPLQPAPAAQARIGHAGEVVVARCRELPPFVPDRARRARRDEAPVSKALGEIDEDVQVATALRWRIEQLFDELITALPLTEHAFFLDPQRRG